MLHFMYRWKGVTETGHGGGREKYVRGKEKMKQSVHTNSFVCSAESAVISGQENTLFENRIVHMWVSTKIAASILGISPNALRIRKCRGEIECRYFGKELRFNVSYLLSLFRDERIAKGTANGN